jgi:hypothetical protein
MEKRERGNIFFSAVDSIEKIMKENSMTIGDLNAALSSEIIVPVSIFKSGYSPLGALIIFLKEKGMTYSEIGKLLHRDSRTIWLTYKKNIKKKITYEKNYQFAVPVGIFSDRNFSVMESLVKELKEIKGIRFVDIAKIVGKSQKTIWCFYNRAIKKCR